MQMIHLRGMHTLTTSSQQGTRKEDPRDGRRATAEHGLQAADPVSEVSSRLSSEDSNTALPVYQSKPKHLIIASLTSRCHAVIPIRLAWPSRTTGASMIM
jgi:hypothetical protein